MTEDLHGRGTARLQLDAFHHQLSTLIAAGVPVHLMGGGRQASQRQLQSITDGYNRAGQLGMTVEEFLSEESTPAIYREAARQWLSGHRSIALDHVICIGESRRYLSYAIGFIGLQASLILISVYLGLVWVCVSLLPQMISLQKGSFTEPGFALRWMIFLRETIMIWGLMVPCLLLGLWLFRRCLYQKFSLYFAPITVASQSLAPLSSILSRPARFQWIASISIALCGIAVLALAVSIVGTTIELWIQVSQSSF